MEMECQAMAQDQSKGDVQLEMAGGEDISDTEHSEITAPAVGKVCNTMANNTTTTTGKNLRAMSLQDEQLLKASLRAAAAAAESSTLETTAEVSTESPVDNREEIFEPRPSTSNSPSRKDLSGKRSMSLAVDTEDRRQRLLLMPRTTQYEKHPLLQDRSHSGLSELEAFLMEKEQMLLEAGGGQVFSRDGQSGGHRGSSSMLPSTSEPRQPLVPRGAHYETHALLVKKNSGMTELEQYLMEKEQEILTEQRRHSDGDAMGEEAKHMGERPLLEPRSSQYQASALLESKDETGLSPIDHLLIAKAEEIDKGKCSARCTCKNAHCPNCKGSSGASSPRSPSQEVEADTTSRIEPKTTSKHVHFGQQDTGSMDADTDDCQQKAKDLPVSGEEDAETQESGGGQQHDRCNVTDTGNKFWKMGSGRKKNKNNKKDLEGQQQQQQTKDNKQALSNDNKQKAKAASASHKHSCAVS